MDPSVERFAAPLYLRARYLRARWTMLRWDRY